MKQLYARLTLARRLSASRAATGYALAEALQLALRAALELFLTPVTVEVTGVEPVAQGLVTANFTATFSGSQQLLELRAFDNASCPSELLEPPWTSSSPLASTPAPRCHALLGRCVRPSGTRRSCWDA